MRILEKWKNIRGYTGYYQVSNLGRIRSVERVVKTKKGVIRKLPSKILKGGKNENGYFIVLLYKDGKIKCRRISRLVANHFIPNPLRKKEVNHKFGNKGDNRAISLEWHTIQENRKHAWATGLNKGNTGKLKANKFNFQT